MNAHVKLLGILQIVWGAIGLLLGVSTLILAVGAVAVGMTSGAARFPPASPRSLSASSRRPCSPPGQGTPGPGSAIHRREAPGRLAALGLAVPNLFVLPFGTALGIYAFWVLLHDEARKMFLKETEAGS